MLNSSIDKTTKKIGSKYLLVNLVAKRAREMKKTHHYQLEDNEYSSKKEIGKALEEVSKNMITIK